MKSTKELRRERERERERECEVKRDREREGKKRQPTHTERERERARNFFHEILALLVTKSYKKLKVQNSEENFPHFAVTKMFKEHFLPLDFCHVTHLQDLKSFVGQY